MGEDLATCVKFRVGCWEDCGQFAYAEYSDVQVLCFDTLSFPFAHDQNLNRNANASVVNIGLGGCGCVPNAVD